MGLKLCENTNNINNADGFIFSEEIVLVEINRIMIEDVAALLFCISLYKYLYRDIYIAKYLYGIIPYIG